MLADVNNEAGYEEEVMSRFIVWATESCWGEPEDSERIEAYANAKRFLASRL